MTQQSHWQALFITVLALTAVACITINVYFPEAAVRDLSEKIEDAVAREAAKIDDGSAPVTDDGGSSEGRSASQAGVESPYARLAHLSRRAVGVVLDWTASDVAAQTGVANPEITNPAIRKIVESRALRVPELENFKRAGALGENNKALLEIRALDALELRQRAAAQKLVREENADRERMFKEIAAATKADLSQLTRIQATYAQTLRQNAKAGEWIQQPDGTWQQKR